jgi:hypothetical protein
MRAPFLGKRGETLFLIWLYLEIKSGVSVNCLEAIDLVETNLGDGL